MSKPKVSINGFGRIGRLVLRAALETGAVDVVTVNDLVSFETNAHLFKYDSVHGIYKGDVKLEGDMLVVDGHKIKLTQIKEPSELPYAALGVEYAIESTGRFTKKADASKLLQAGAKKVIISAPANDADFTVVMGVNCDKIPADAQVLSNASCTTNCLAPLVKVLHDKFGIVKGLVTTIHSYTNDQNVQDQGHKDLRRARAAAVSMIPTSTGAARAIGLVMPELKGKLDGLAIRVPTPNVSLVDFTVEVKADTTKADVNAALKAAATSGPLAPYLDYSEEPLVSIDFNHNPASSTVDGDSTYVVGNMVKVLSWYDNEWGYSSRCIDLIKKMAG